MAINLEQLYEKLGYEFSNTRLLEIALTHRSMHGENYERLEFLGDSIVNFIIARALFDKFPNAKEGKLSRLRASLVSGESLATVARAFNLGEYILLGPGEQKSGGSNRSSLLADTLEAVVGAIYLDSDMTHCQSLVLDWFSDRLTSASLEKLQKDPKTRLQEIMQSKSMPLPHYKIIQTEGHAHTQIFHVSCSVNGLDITTVGKGTSRRRAEQEAAENFLQELQA